MINLPDTNVYQSSVTGPQIDLAVKAVLTVGNVKQYQNFSINSSDWIISATTADKQSGKYYADVSFGGTSYIGAYPYVFFVTIDNEYIVPDIKYDMSSSNTTKFRMYSNINLAGTAVAVGYAMSIDKFANN